MRDGPVGSAFRVAPVVVVAAAVGAGCVGGATSPSGASDGGLVTERITEDGVPVVHVLSGSAWAAPAHLQEELSIGVMEGDPNAMFGSIADLWLTDDEIYVLDAQDSSVRVFDRRGRFRRRFGSPGQGPGETEFPGEMVVTDDGRVLIDDSAKVVVYTTDGLHLPDWPLRTAAVQGLVATHEGAYARVSLPREAPTAPPAIAFQRVGPAGLTGEVRSVPDLRADPRTLTVEMGGSSYTMTVPLTLPGTVSALAPNGDLVYGFPSDRYRFYIQRRDGETLAVERETEAVEIAPGEREEARLQLLSLLRQRNPSFAWDGAEIPSTRPYYSALIPDQSGRVWVGRQGASRRVEGCDPPDARRGMRTYQPCWEPERVLEVFSLADGSYLGRVERPANAGFWAPFILGSHLVAATVDEIGTPVVKLFRIVVPEERPTS